MSKYIPITDIVFKVTNNKFITNYSMSYIIGEKPCEYLKDVVHYYILNELQLFQLTRFCTYYRYYFMDLDFNDKELMFQIHTYLINNITDNKILVSAHKRGLLRNMKYYCLHRYNENEYTFIYKRTRQQTIN